MPTVKHIIVTILTVAAVNALIFRVAPIRKLVTGAA